MSKMIMKKLGLNDGADFDEKIAALLTYLAGTDDSKEDRQAVVDEVMKMKAGEPDGDEKAADADKDGDEDAKEMRGAVKSLAEAVTKISERIASMEKRLWKPNMWLHDRRRDVLATEGYGTWQTEPPTPGLWRVRIRPEIRDGFPSVVECEVWPSPSGMMVNYRPGSDPLPLNLDWFVGARWQRIEEEADPVDAGEIPHPE